MEQQNIYYICTKKSAVAAQSSPYISLMDNMRLKMLCRHAGLFVNLSTRSVLTFTDPSQEDLGLYTVEMSDNPHLSSSYDFTAEGTI